MAIDAEITRNVEQIRNATYGKDVREAIASGLERCYEYTSGEGADEAAQRANAAADRVEGMIASSEQAVRDVEEALEDIDDIIAVSATQPSASTNKIWIQPQDETEYKVASFSAYETLWSRMNEINRTYEQGHGGIKSIVLDAEYDDPEDELKKRYIITYSDDTTGEFFVENGPEGPAGPIDTIKSTKIYYKKVLSQNFDGRPPTDDFSDNVPTLGPGDYLWTITEITYNSYVDDEESEENHTKAYIYGLTRMGLNGRDGIDGSGAVNAVALGTDGEALPNTDGTVRVPLDQEPNAGSGSLLTSAAVYNALSLKAPLDNPTFTGTPRSTTPSSGDSTTRIATTAFVQDAIGSIDIASSALQVELTMSEATLHYTNGSISEDTVVLGFADFEGGTFTSPINWTTTTGDLYLTTDAAPSTPVTFKVIMIETVGVQQ